MLVKVYKLQDCGLIIISTPYLTFLIQRLDLRSSITKTPELSTFKFPSRKNLVPTRCYSHIIPSTLALLNNRNSRKEKQCPD